jgi:DHA2 family multidrug resistance protein
VISNLVDKEAMTMSVDHVFFILTLVFIVASLLIWLAPKPKTKVTGPSH